MVNDEFSVSILDDNALSALVRVFNVLVIRALVVVFAVENDVLSVSILCANALLAVVSV